MIKKLIATAFIASGIALIPASSATAAAKCKPPAKPNEVPHVNYQGMQSILYCYGPITIKPGQNTIVFKPTSLKPKVPGYITRFDPDLVYADSKGNRVPRVDVLHLHHAVWQACSQNDPIWAAGEEKTIVQVPQGFGWRAVPKACLIVNHMIHNLFPTTEKVFLTWRVDFVPDSSPAAASIKPAETLWLDAAGFSAYPVFDAKRGMGSGGTYTFPDQTTDPAEVRKIGGRADYTVPADMTILGGIGHLHPGGLSVNLGIKRGAQSRELFRSEAKYFEPAGAVSWDVAMTSTPESWRVKVKKGDRLLTSGTYDVSKASWYESMAIMPLLVYRGQDQGGVDPLVSQPQTTCDSCITHTHLNENNGHGGTIKLFNDPTAARAGSSVDGKTVGIRKYLYGLGDPGLGGIASRPPTVKEGGTFTFRNRDNVAYEFHTITACKAPCNKDAGIAYPLADGPVDFDSGELGKVRRSPIAGYAPTANRVTWNIPNNLAQGTYTYFCRIHPFMRGAFRVVPR